MRSQIHMGLHSRGSHLPLYRGEIHVFFHSLGYFSLSESLIIKDSHQSFIPHYFSYISSNYYSTPWGRGLLSPAKATVHKSTSVGFNQREAVSSAVGMLKQLKRYIVLRSATRHSGQVGGAWLIGSMWWR